MRAKPSTLPAASVAFFAALTFVLHAQTPAQPPPAQPPAQTPNPANPQQPQPQQTAPMNPPPQNPKPDQPKPDQPKPDQPKPDAPKPEDENKTPAINPSPMNPDSMNPGGDAADVSPNAPDYTGPSILSRGYSLSRPSLPTNERFRPFVGINAVYDSGLTGAFLGPNNQPTNQSSEGLDLNWGISGRHIRRKDTFDLDYRGHENWYRTNTVFNSSDHALSAGYTRYISRRFIVSVHETAGEYSNTYSVLNATSITDISLANTIAVNPNTEPFSNRTYFSTTSADVLIQKSARWSFDAGGAYFLNRRAGSALTNTTGNQAHGDTSYRITKRTSIGIYYGFSTYRFGHNFGDTYVNSVGATYSYAFSRTTELKLRAGGSNVETSGLTAVSLSPIVAVLLGQSFGIQRFYSKTFVPDFAVDFTRHRGHSTITGSAAFGVSPGNGLFLTSRHDSESVSYSYNGLKKYGFGVSAGRDHLGSLGNVAGAFASYYGRLNVSRPLPRHLHAEFSANYQQQGFSFSGYHRKDYRVAAGIAYAPGAGPLKFW